MKTEQEIKDKILMLYEAKDKMNSCIDKQKTIENPTRMVMSLTDRFYNEKIETLKWVLNG